MQSATHPADHLSTKLFEAVAQLVQAHTGIKLPATKRTMLEGRLRRRVRAAGCRSLDEYAAQVVQTQEGPEFDRLINAITTNKTEFFREPAHYEWLQNRIIPELVKTRKRSPAMIKLWSAACSTGAEAFSAAMVLQDLMIQRRDFQYAILGTDISTEVLAEAEAAIYPSAMMDQVWSDKRARYVMPAKDPRRDISRIAPELRQRVTFRQLNLTDSSYSVDGDVDVIFCRNVLIYFQREMQEAVVRKLASHLRPGGFLLLGHSESMAANGAPWLRQIGPTVLQAPADGKNGVP